MASLTVRGSGDPWLVVHGGPGFNHRYMISALEPLASRRQLVFYDQVGIEDESITYPVGLDGMGKQLADILTEVFPSGPISVIAHSWGTLVLAAAVRKLAAQDLVSADQLRGLLVNPVPFQRSAFDAARINFASRIPPEVFAHALQSAQSDATGLAAMRILLPFYLLKSPQIPLELELSLATYSHVLGGLTDFDYTDVLRMMCKCHVLLGSNDITDKSLLANMLTAVASVTSLETGHFPFHEEPLEAQTFFERVTSY